MKKLKVGEVVKFPCGSVATVEAINPGGVELEYFHQSVTVRFESTKAIRKLLDRIDALKRGGAGK